MSKESPNAYIGRKFKDKTNNFIYEIREYLPLKRWFKCRYMDLSLQRYYYTYRTLQELNDRNVFEEVVTNQQVQVSVQLDPDVDSDKIGQIISGGIVRGVSVNDKTPCRLNPGEGYLLMDDMESNEIKGDALDEINQTELKCECGMDKIGGGVHSEWCPKYEAV